MIVGHFKFKTTMKRKTTIRILGFLAGCAVALCIAAYNGAFGSGTAQPEAKKAPRYFIQMYPPGQEQLTVHADSIYHYPENPCIVIYPGTAKRMVFCGTFRVTEWGQ